MASVSDIYQYKQAAPDLATSGQPREEQLAAIAADGYEVVVNLALHDDPRYSLPDEPGCVRRLGLEYVHIPVSFDAPTGEDLQTFFDAMDARKGKRIWLHCAANLRVTAFLGLYRAIRERWSHDQAFALMADVWKPNPVWEQFIGEQLRSAGDG
jgi:protein tyrosine phosphatase (PTP) superfamily phosphohydrolase (DUF442 family)